jgi:hypothetical protein
MSTPLQQAIKCLRIRDVLVRSSQSSIAEDFDPVYDAEAEGLVVQLKHVVTRSQVMEVEGDGQSQRLFRVFVDLGARWIEAPPESVTKAQVNQPEPPVKALIEATMIAEYELTEELNKEALDVFALKNASYHVWPYWREFLSSQCQRMGLPKAVVPAVQFAKNHADKVEACDQTVKVDA